MKTETLRAPHLSVGRSLGSVRPHLVLESLLIFLIFFITGGAPAPHVNETHYLAKAKHYWDPSYCPHDFFLNSADPHLTFYWTLGWWTRFFSLTAMAWVGRVVAWAALAVAWQRLAGAVVGVRWASVLSAAIWATLIETANFAGEWVVGGVEAKCFAYALVLLGLADLATGRWRACWIWFGAAGAFHVLVGAWAVIAALAVWVTEGRGRRAPFMSMLSGLALGGVLSLPGLLPALALERGVDPQVTAEAARIYVFDRLPHHLAPLSLPGDELLRRLIRFGVMAGAFLALWAWVRSQPGVPGGRAVEDDAWRQWRPLERIMRMAAVALACNCEGLVIEAALVERPLLAARWLRYYWFRQADVLVPLAVGLSGARAVSVLLHRRAVGGIAAAVLSVGACGWCLVDTTIARLDALAPPAAQKMEDFASWRGACDWIRENTAADATFLIPRSGQSFKWYAARADVANYKDVPQDAASVVEWRRRCRELFPLVGAGETAQMQSSPEQWGTQRAKSLAAKYGAAYVVARSFPPLDLKVVYPPAGDAADSSYAVYETGVSTRGAQP
ncbi:MAG: hypothetical protein IT424_13570 [Pirellulales bacterium]|nr:hypothetical protein [Pirellulales bacterium]